MTPMKLLAATLFALLVLLQYRLWVGEGSIAHLKRLQADILAQQTDNERLRERRRLLAAEVHALKTSSDAIEEHARQDLGMIKKGETFFMVVDAPRESATN